MRKKIIVGNWKMHKTISEAKEFASEILPFAKECSTKNVILGIAPTYLCLKEVKEIVGENLLVAAQNCHYEEKGAFTGDISLPMLKEIGVSWSLVGHSERRLYSNETNTSCNKKILALFAKKMLPIYCVGESLIQYEMNQTKDVVKAQLVEGLAGVSSDDAESLVIAYEPVWSIGTGKNASTEIAEDVCHYIRTVIMELFGNNVAEKVLIQYGGSVKPENAYDYLHCPNIDGVLVGGASLKVDSFIALTKGAY